MSDSKRSSLATTCSALCAVDRCVGLVNKDPEICEAIGKSRKGSAEMQSRSAPFG